MFKVTRFVFLSFVSITLLFSSVTNSAPKQKVTIGRIETLTLPKYSITFESRIDTGAHTCSLHVTNQRITQVGNDRYIEFDTEDGKGGQFHIKTLIHKESRVKNTSGEIEVRYVIRETVQMGSVTKEVNINLNDRTELKYNFLVGRNFLRGDFLVDVSSSHVLSE